jgi:hypothetical protein
LGYARFKEIKEMQNIGISFEHMKFGKYFKFTLIHKKSHIFTNGFIYIDYINIKSVIG